MRLSGPPASPRHPLIPIVGLLLPINFFYYCLRSLILIYCWYSVCTRVPTVVILHTHYSSTINTYHYMHLPPFDEKLPTAAVTPGASTPHSTLVTLSGLCFALHQPLVTRVGYWSLLFAMLTSRASISRKSNQSVDSRCLPLWIFLPSP